MRDGEITMNQFSSKKPRARVRDLLSAFLVAVLFAIICIPIFAGILTAGNSIGFFSLNAQELALAYSLVTPVLVVIFFFMLRKRQRIKGADGQETETKDEDSDTTSSPLPSMSPGGDKTHEATSNGLHGQIVENTENYFQQPSVNNENYIEIICLSCFKSLKIPKQYAGKSGRCNNCNAHIDVPINTTLSNNTQAKKRKPTGLKLITFEEFREKAEFLISLLVVAIMCFIWSFILYKEHEGKLLLFIVSVFSFIFSALIVFIILGGELSDRLYARLGLYEDLQHNVPLNILNGTLGILALSHFAPVAPFVLYMTDFSKFEPSYQYLVINFLLFGMFPLTANSFLRRGNLWSLGITAGLYGCVFLISTYGIFVLSDVNSIIVKLGQTPIFYWAVSGFVALLAIGTFATSVSKQK